MGENEILVTARWLLSNLIVYLRHHLSYACRIKKHGTLLYRSNGDLLTAHSNALYKGKLKKDVTAHANATMEVHPTHHVDEMNALIHKQIQKILTADLTTTYRFDQIEVDVLVSEIDPQLWSFMKSITRSIFERRGYDVKANKMHTSPYHIHKIRCLFCLCVQMFCTDDRCSTPLHMLVTDTTDRCGGSTELIRILKRLGVCASSDTLARCIQHKVEERQRWGPEQDCVESLPTIISVDNIDFQNSYSRVFCGKQKSSWHGTTVQVVQPSIITNDLYDQWNCTEPLQVHSPCSTHGESTSSMLTNEVQYENRHLECRVYDMPITQEKTQSDH